ncbi:MAG: triose-phosphate isomerase [Spirochaetales bacterium]|nr:triose-phosphate isomerase [Spirochaetales bacterium]
MRKTYIAGNWKMHKTRSEAAALAQELESQIKNKSVKVMIAPPFTSLEAVAGVLKSGNILLGAQNMASEESGAHTGEVSALMLKDLGVHTVILGHSERRLIYGETDELVNRKVHLALKHDFEVILCVGETLEQREAGQAVSVVEKQIDSGLSGLSEAQLRNLVIAYEPVWAIGTGKTATPEDADEIHKVIRTRLASLYNTAAAESMIIQYGGSVKPENAAELLGMENIDGALVGGASLKSDSFLSIVNSK